MSPAYLALEIRRVLRSPATLLFTIGFPAVFYLLVAAVYEEQAAAGSPGAITPTSTMVSMNAWGLLLAGLLIGSRVVNERASGWQRQLRLTPLSAPAYLAGKLAASQVVALPTAVVVPALAVAVHGVDLDARGWLSVTVAMWLGGSPFAIAGVLIGQVASQESVQSVTVVVMLVLALFGGLFVPLENLPAWWADIAPVLPTRRLVELGLAGVDGGGTVAAVATLATWTVLLAAAVAWRYHHDSARR